MSIIGHERLVAYFDRIIASGSLAQAYCFSGPAQVGKRTVAERIAAKLLCHDAKHLSTHPDFVFMKREEDVKTGKLKKDLSIKQARDLRERLRHTSWSTGYRVVIMDEAEFLNEEAGNALLKITEDAGTRTVFFFLTVDDEALLPTIRSRCQVFYLSLVGEQKIMRGLQDIGCIDEAATEAALLSWGRPGRAIQMLENEEERQKYYQEVRRWQSMSGQPFYKKIKQMEEFFSEKSDTIRTQDRLSEVLEIWIMIWREALLQKAGLALASRDKEEISFVQKQPYSLRAIADLMEKMKEAQTLLRQNVNSKLLIEQLLLV